MPVILEGKSGLLFASQESLPNRHKYFATPLQMAAALPPLENLYRLNSKRTREIFASEPSDTLAEDETRYVFGH
jgi:hypothetical protein